MTGYGDAAPLYLAAGWSAPLPLPAGCKAWPPPGYTGRNGYRPTPELVERWRDERADGNLCLRLGASVIGVDLDLYKQPDARTRLEELLGGPLPPTWCSTSRHDGSGIYLYRVPPLPAGQRWRSAPLPGVELVQRSHRYVVCWPSIHPEGRPYRWLDHNGADADRPPVPDDLTFLDTYPPLLEDAAAHDERQPVAFDLTDGEPSEPVTARLQAGLAACHGAHGSRHDAVRDVICALVRLAERGEPGVTDVLAVLGRAFVDAVTPDRPSRRDAEHEYTELVAGAIALVASTEPLATGVDAPLELVDVTLEAFAAVDEPGARALLGSADDALIPADADVMIYGDGGAGKTTLAVDLACHFAAGDTWLGITIAETVGVLLVENEGPRPLFRRKVRRKLAAWAGSPLDGRVRIVESPWARFSFAHESHRQALAKLIAAHQADVVIIGPLVAAGMNDAGTLQEVRAFVALCDDVRRRAGRPVTFILIHHEGKSTKVSGAWEGCGDTLIHVTGMGHGRTRMYVQKARWATSQHAKTLELGWTDGEGFELAERPEMSDDELAGQILSVVGEASGTGWARVERAITGVSNDRKRTVRDRLLADGRLVNVVRNDGVEVALDHCPERRPARLYLADDPTIAHLCRDSGTAPAQPVPPSGAGVGPACAVRPVRSTGAGGAHAPGRLDLGEPEGWSP